MHIKKSIMSMLNLIMVSTSHSRCIISFCGVSLRGVDEFIITAGALEVFVENRVTTTFAGDNDESNAALFSLNEEKRSFCTYEL